MTRHHKTPRARYKIDNWPAYDRALQHRGSLMAQSGGCFELGFPHWLLLGSEVVLDLSRDQAGDQGIEQGFAASARVVHEPEEAEVERQLILRDATVRAQPGAQQRPKPLHGVDVDLAEAAAVLVAGVFAAGMADRFVPVTPSGQAGRRAGGQAGRRAGGQAGVDAVLIRVDKGTAGVLAAKPWRSGSVIACVSEVSRPSSRAICRFERPCPVAPAPRWCSCSTQSRTIPTTSSCCKFKAPSPSMSARCSASGSAAASYRKHEMATTSPAAPLMATATCRVVTPLPGRIVVDEQEAELVRRVYGWFTDEQTTIRQVIKRLNAGPDLPRSGRPAWSASMVHHMLADPIYAGTAYANRYTYVSATKPRSPRGPRNSAGRRCLKPREQWIAIPVPALVDQSTWDRAQAQLAPPPLQRHVRRLPHSLVHEVPDLRASAQCRSDGHQGQLRLPG